MERLIISICAQVYKRMFEALYNQLSPGIKLAIDDLLVTLPGDLYLLKESPTPATVTSIKRYMKRYAATTTLASPANRRKKTD
ncbi:hypothetical protein [Photorhabdus luminescens]|uniref:hypothetical protein n=1 Tax=Photorhabdus luminescens TaxID=29488 RepID=UPI001962272B|nr:hypothetical protein [Photorhabdus luminescens]